MPFVAPNSPSHTVLIRLMSFMLVPLACWQLWIFPFIPYYHLQHLFAYPVCLYCIWLIGTGHIRLIDMFRRWRVFIPLALLIVLLQSIALWQNTPLPDTVSLMQRLWRMGFALGKVVLMWPMLIIVGEVCLFTVQRSYALRASAIGYACASGTLLLLCLVQGVAVYTVEAHSALLQAVHDYCARLLLTISPYIEARWLDAVYNFYDKGAYSLTIPRVNGFFEEASALAGWIGTFFLPLSFGCLFVRSSQMPRLPLYGWSGAILWILILFLHRSTTGQAIAIAALALLLLFSLRGKARVFTASLALLCVGLCLAIALYAPHVATYLQDRNKYWDISTLPRIIIMRDTVDMISQYPLTGVGRGNFSAHIVQGTRYKDHADSNEELSQWRKAGSVPPLSALLGFTAQYGIPLTLLLGLGIGRIWFTLYSQWRARPDQPLSQFAFATASAWSVLAGVATIGSLDMRNPLFMLPLCTLYALAYWQKQLAAEVAHAA